jgi:hypothetical protein
LPEEGGVEKTEAGPTKAADRPDARGIEGSVRGALKQYIENVLFNPSNPDGEPFRTAVLIERGNQEREQAKKEMVAQASRWMPKARGWEKEVDGDKTTYVGRLYQLHTEITLDKTGKVLKVNVEID